MIDTTGSDLGEYAKWELLISGLNENLGRLIEDSNPHVAKVAGFAKNYLDSKTRLDKTSSE